MLPASCREAETAHGAPHICRARTEERAATQHACCRHVLVFPPIPSDVWIRAILGTCPLPNVPGHVEDLVGSCAAWVAINRRGCRSLAAAAKVQPGGCGALIA